VISTSAEQIPRAAGAILIGRMTSDTVSGCSTRARSRAADNAKTVDLFRSALKAAIHWFDSDTAQADRLHDEPALRHIGHQRYVATVDASGLAPTDEFGVAFNLLACAINRKALIAE
jgi:hypothetical protein